MAQPKHSHMSRPHRRRRPIIILRSFSAICQVRNNFADARVCVLNRQTPEKHNFGNTWIVLVFRKSPD